MKFFVKIFCVSIITATLIPTAFAQEQTKISQSKIHDLQENWTYHQKLEKEVLSLTEKNNDILEKSIPPNITNEQSTQLIIESLKKTKQQSLDLMQKFKPKTKEMQDLMQIKIELLDITMDKLIKNTRNQESTEDIQDEDINKIQNLIIKGKSIQDDLKKTISLSSN